MNKKIMIIISIIVLVVVVGGAFYGGLLYGKSHPVIRPGAPLDNGARFGAGRIGGPTGAGFVSGSLVSKDNNSITVSLPTGGSKIVFYSDKTQIQQLILGNAGNLLPGNCQLVTVTGTNNSDGSVTAQSIQIRSDPKCMPNAK